MLKHIAMLLNGALQALYCHQFMETMEAHLRTVSLLYVKYIHKLKDALAIKLQLRHQLLAHRLLQSVQKAVLQIKVVLKSTNKKLKFVQMGKILSTLGNYMQTLVSRIRQHVK